jgi:hypothetical protein
MTILHVIGDSSVEVIAAAWASVRDAPEVVVDASVGFSPLGQSTLFEQPFFDRLEYAVRFNSETVTNALATLTGEREIALQSDTVFGFCLGQAANLCEDPLWLRYAPWRVATALGLQALSDSACELAFQKRNRYILAFFDAVQDLGVEFFVVPTLPPAYDEIADRTRVSPLVSREVSRLFCLWFERKLTRRDCRYLPLAGEPRQPNDGVTHSQEETSLQYGPQVARQVAELLIQRDLDIAAASTGIVVVLRGAKLTRISSDAAN